MAINRTTSAEGHDFVTLTLREVQMSDLGYYECILDSHPQLSVKQYIFTRGKFIFCSFNNDKWQSNKSKF